MEIIGQKTMEYYENRDDRVVYRSIKYDYIISLDSIQRIDNKSKELPRSISSMILICKRPVMF